MLKQKLKTWLCRRCDTTTMFCGAAESLLSFSTERNNLAIQQGKVTRAKRWLTGWPRICLPEASWRSCDALLFLSIAPRSVRRTRELLLLRR